MFFHMGVENLISCLKIIKILKYNYYKRSFEHGFLFPELLRFVDFYANFAYGNNTKKIFRY